MMRYLPVALVLTLRCVWCVTHPENLQLFRGKTSQADALLECQTRGGYLVSIYSAEENEALLDFLQSEIRPSDDIPTIWTSGRDISESGKDNAWDWTEGRDFPYTSWSDDPPNMGGRDCLMFDTTSGEWSAVNCAEPTRAFVCELPNLEFFPEGQTWEAANAACAEVENGTLLSMESVVEFTSFELYIRANGVNSVWLGGSRNSEGLWVWSDGSGVFLPDESRTAPFYGGDFVPWVSTVRPDEDCAALSNNPNGLEAYECAAVLPFMCEYPPGYVKPDPIPNPDGTLLYYPLPLPFWDAEVSCTEVGGHLASVLSAFENDFIQTFAIDSTEGAANVQAWIGGRNHDRGATVPKDDYFWTDGSGRGINGRFDYDNFAVAPNIDELRCVEMDVDTGTWTDFNCEVSNPYICRIPQWEYFPTPTNWVLANEVCRNQSGSLVSILTADQNSAMQRFVLQQSGGGAELKVWTGGNDLDEEGVFKWSDGSGVFWTRDEPNAVFDNFANGEPNNFGSEHCVEMDLGEGGDWHDNKCDSEFPFVCEFSYNGDAPTPAPVDRDIVPYDPPQTGQWQIVTQRLSFLDAAHTCETEGGILASVTSQLDQDVLVSLLQLLARNSESVHLGAQSLDNGTFTWMDDTPLTYTNWAENEPVTDGTIRCVQMDTSTGLWSTHSCADEVTVASVCDRAFRFDGDHDQWTYFSGALSWPAAARVCAEGAGYLVSVKTAGQNRELYNFIELQNDLEPAVWLGGNTNNQGVFEWHDDSGEFWSLRDGSVGRYVNWQDGEPNDFDVDQCVVLNMRTGGLWEDRACRIEEGSEDKFEPFDFVCEYPTPLTWRYIEGELPFTAAEGFCRTVGGSIIGVHTQEDEDAVADFLRRSGATNVNSTWIGGHAINTNGLYEWADGAGQFWQGDANGTELAYTNWAPGEPSGVDADANEKCVEMELESGRWSNVDCDTPHYFACEYRTSPRRRHICENSEDDLICPVNHKLSIISVNYGRSQPNVCNSLPEYEMCDNSMTSLLKVAELCDGQERCTVEATNNFFGNTCSGVTKYLDVVYECVPQRIDICQGDVGVLACPIGKQINISANVNYGTTTSNSRCTNDVPATAPTTCSFGAETYATLSAKCDGRRVCVVEAIDEEFSPCDDEEQEFLRAEFECIPPPTPMPTSSPTPLPTALPSPSPTLVGEKALGGSSDDGSINTVVIASAIAVVGVCCILGGIIIFIVIRRRKDKAHEMQGDQKDLEDVGLENGYGFKPVEYDTSSPANRISGAPPGGATEPGTGFTPASTMTRPSVSLPPSVGVGANGVEPAATTVTPANANGVGRLDRSQTTISPVNYPDENKHDVPAASPAPPLIHRYSSTAAPDDSGTDDEEEASDTEDDTEESDDEEYSTGDSDEEEDDSSEYESGDSDYESDEDDEEEEAAAP